MGRLTDDMAQLRGDIDNSRATRLAQQNARVSSVSRQIAEFAATRASDSIRDSHARATFVANNANNINQTLNSFCNARQLMGQQGRESRAAFASNMAKETSDLLNGFNAERKSMAETSAKDRANFMISMSNTVAAFINEASQDRAGARAAFFGVTSSKKKNDILGLAIRFTDKPYVEKQETIPTPHKVQGDEQTESLEQVSSFSQLEDLAKLETFSEPDTKSSETKKHRRKTQ